MFIDLMARSNCDVVTVLDSSSKYVCVCKCPAAADVVLFLLNAVYVTSLE